MSLYFRHKYTRVLNNIMINIYIEEIFYHTSIVIPEMQVFCYTFNQTIYKKLAWSSTRLNNRLICFGQVYDESIEYRISSIEPNSGIDKYRRNQVSNQHYC